MSESLEFDARDRNTFRLHATPLRRVAVRLASILFAPLMWLDVKGLKWVPDEGAIVLASNHVSNFDVFAMQLALPRPIFFMGKAELFKYEPLGSLLRDFGAFPVYRGERDSWALRHARKVLDAGQILGMFPEGHRSKGRGLGVAKNGTARLAIEADCPILPMVIIGSERLFESLPQRARVSITFLPPMHAQGGESPEQLTERLMLTLAAALPEAMRGEYGGG